jgi:hypothetical protein
MPVVKKPVKKEVNTKVVNTKVVDKTSTGPKRNVARDIAADKFAKNNKDRLTKSELDALSHQKRGMGEISNSYVKKSGSIMNDVGYLSQKQSSQLKQYMNKASLPKKIYEALPNVGRVLGDGNSAADIPKNSKLRNQRNGGTVKAKDGKWMQKAAASIKRRGTEGKCTPITKPGCTGKAKALAKTFKKIAKSNKKK